MMPVLITAAVPFVVIGALVAFNVVRNAWRSLTYRGWYQR
jgi:hypothetical protein